MIELRVCSSSLRFVGNGRILMETITNVTHLGLVFNEQIRVACTVNHVCAIFVPEPAARLLLLYLFEFVTENSVMDIGGQPNGVSFFREISMIR